MPSDELLKLAEELKESREKAEVSLQQIASKTRIDLKFLKAIEEGDFGVLPEVYIRAFIKEYAVHCNLDPAKTLEKYDLAKKGKSIDAADSEEITVPQKKTESKTQKQFTDNSAGSKSESEVKGNRNKVILISAIGFALVIIVAGYFYFIKSASPEIVVEKPFEEVLSQQKQRYEIADEPEQTIAETPTDSLNLSIKGTDTCWVNVTIDGLVDKEFMLYNNTSILVKAAEKFDLVVGNSAGISIELNGAPIELNGSKGQRKTFSVNKNGLINPSN